ncbi:hypothetical protein [Nonomuraea cypriaca]|nr:hypothetical protein [Nonomuraea cypriaca]
MVIHRSDPHGTLLRACRPAGVDLVDNVTVTGYEQALRPYALGHVAR